MARVRKEKDIKLIYMKHFIEKSMRRMVRQCKGEKYEKCSIAIEDKKENCVAEVKKRKELEMRGPQKSETKSNTKIKIKKKVCSIRPVRNTVD